MDSSTLLLPHRKRREKLINESFFASEKFGVLFKKPHLPVSFTHCHSQSPFVGVGVGLCVDERVCP